MVINFHPDSDKPEFIAAAETYKKIWQENGDKIVKAYQTISGLDFVEKEINAVIYEGVSHAYPFSLRASYPDEQKLSTIIHELGHRLINASAIPKQDNVLEIHKILDLILFDVWVELYGEEVAKRNVEVESDRTAFYKEAWDWALSFDKEKRQEEFQKLKNTGG